MENISKNESLFEVISSIRDTVNIASKKVTNVTYENTFRIIYDLDEKLYDACINEFQEKNKNDTAKEFIEKAKLQSLIKKEDIFPINLIQTEIDELTELINIEGINKEDKKHTKARIKNLEIAKESIRPRRLSENAILNSDFAHKDKSGVFGEKLLSHCKYVEYELSESNTLRLRVLHPDKEEHITGADLVYEQYDMENELVRVLFLQYKTWGDNGVIYQSNTNLLEQLEKMNSIICKQNLCAENINATGIDKFRFPCCTGFLRPTDKQQYDSKTILSSGYIIPACHAIELLKTDKKIEKKAIKSKVVNHIIFEELFAHNLIGSKWFSVKFIEKYYEALNIIQPKDKILVYAREFINEKECIDKDFASLAQ
ncbi:unnamed protein product [Rotaria magnacalcarata]|uniref:Uncharacterized protein n=1 Tax=Rotaria magnacalcarata TaxID=392030 RepID=A0A819QY15_9BILA|nr:unnamed protein product [Rotaria magnacalcarata]CAF4036784.1 unnamed protein product [Rotaria magnacalcarata]